jgi:hypothetical protein
MLGVTAYSIPDSANLRGFYDNPKREHLVNQRPFSL